MKIEIILLKCYYVLINNYVGKHNLNILQYKRHKSGFDFKIVHFKYGCNITDTDKGLG